MNMQTQPAALLRFLTITSALCFAIAPRIAFAQAAPPTPTTPTTETTTTTPTTAMVTAPEVEEPVVLSPFFVDATLEQGSYMASSTLGGTRVATDVEDIASALTIVTAQFLKDTQANDNQGLLIYTPNAEVAGINGNFSGQGGAGNATFTENVLNPQTTTRIRGLAPADNTRGYFLTDIPWDSFDTGRVDIQRGPNSILFGVGSPSGIINADINDAEFTNSNNVTDRYGSYNSFRNSLDINRVLIPNVLSIRLGWLNDEEKYQENYSYNNQTRYFAALRYDPNLLGKQNHTSFRVKFEHGDISSDNPRALPPTDEITPWFTAGKPTINEYTPGWSVGSTNSYNAYPIFNILNGTRFSGTDLQEVLNLYNTGNTTPILVQVPRIGGTTVAGGAGPYGTILDLPVYEPAAVADYASYAVSFVPGGDFYADKALTDPSIFNFFDNLLDGPNEHQGQNWNALNAALSQTFFDNRLGFELVYDTQRYYNFETGYLAGSNYGINIDPNVTLSNGTPNPNLGRPYVSDYVGNESNGSTLSNRNALRLTGTADIRASDFFGRKSFLTYLLGHQDFTGLVEEENDKTQSISWDQYATTPDWEQTIGVALNSPLGDYRNYDNVTYIGPSLLNASSASGLGLSPVSQVLAPPPTETVSYFNTTWNNPSVSPMAPFTYIDPTSATTLTGTQSSNPANYVGWTTTSIQWLNANNPADFPALVTGGTRTRYQDRSQGFVYQGHFLDGDFVPTFGWRKDYVFNNITQAPESTTSTFVSTHYGFNSTDDLTTVGETKAWGGVYHLSKYLTRWLPWNTRLSVFFNDNQNFIAEAPRESLNGTVLPNPTGKTKEYGYELSTLDGKLTLKITKYRTLVANATLDNTNVAGLGGDGFFVWAMPTWFYEFAAYLQQGMQGNTNIITTDWNYGYYDQLGGIAGHTGNTATVENPNDPDVAIQKNIIQAWLNIPIPDAFFTAWGIHPDALVPSKAKASGQLADAFVGTLDPFHASFNPESFTIETAGGLNPVTTVDTLSSGEEFEVAGQPLPNWNIAMNASRTFASRSNIDALTKDFMATVEHWLTTTDAGLLPIGTTLLPPAGAYNAKYFWDNYVYNPYLALLADQGQMAPELPPWTFNLITTYNFNRGPLKGYFIGGGVRMEAGRIEGYHYAPTTGLLDVTNPWVGPADYFYDLWFGYQHKIFNNKIDWRIQVNLHNVGEKTHLIPASYEPDGTYALERIYDGMSWQITNSFDF
jgi:hypothetical protein